MCKALVICQMVLLAMLVNSQHTTDQSKTKENRSQRQESCFEQLASLTIENLVILLEKSKLVGTENEKPNVTNNHNISQKHKSQCSVEHHNHSLQIEVLIRQHKKQQEEELKQSLLIDALSMQTTIQEDLQQNQSRSIEDLYLNVDFFKRQQEKQPEQFEKLFNQSLQHMQQQIKAQCEEQQRQQIKHENITRVWNSILLTQKEASCKDILAQDRTASSGIYRLRAAKTEAIIEVYCEMGINGGGYTFINPQFLSKITNADIQAMFTDTGSFLMRVRKTNGMQPYGVLSQLSQYASIPLKLFHSQHTLYRSTVNAGILGSPYLYYGFLPINEANNNNVQGLRVNGNPLTFTNGDKNPNSYISLHANFQEKSPSTYAFSITGATWPLCTRLFASAINNPSGRAMPVEYFMFTETHWGGGGCYAQTDGRSSTLGILGTAIGFR